MVLGRETDNLAGKRDLYPSSFRSVYFLDSSGKLKTVRRPGCCRFTEQMWTDVQRSGSGKQELLSS